MLDEFRCVLESSRVVSGRLEVQRSRHSDGTHTLRPAAVVRSARGAFREGKSLAQIAIRRFELASHWNRAHAHSARRFPTARGAGRASAFSAPPAWAGPPKKAALGREESARSLLRVSRFKREGDRMIEGRLTALLCSGGVALGARSAIRPASLIPTCIASASSRCRRSPARTSCSLRRPGTSGRPG
jgi:hypothetical protein